MSVKDIVIQYGLASVGVVLAAAVSAKMIFVWLDDLILSKKRDAGLDEMIQQKLTALGSPVLRRPTETPAPPPKALEDLRPEDPDEVKKKIILQRIYHFDGKRGAQETEEAYCLRLLGMKTLESAEHIKRAFKAQAREYHPDKFPLDLFEKKLRKKLAARVHDNYILLQRAQGQLLKKASKS